MKEICRDLNDEYEALDAIVAPLSEEQWNLMTPSVGWNIKYQIAHVAWADMLARMATTDEEAFKKLLDRMVSDRGAIDEFQRELREAEPSYVMDYWRRERKDLVDALEARNPKDRIPWFGPTMSARSRRAWRAFRSAITWVRSGSRTRIPSSAPRASTSFSTPPSSE